MVFEVLARKKDICDAHTRPRNDTLRQIDVDCCWFPPVTKTDVAAIRVDLVDPTEHKNTSDKKWRSDFREVEGEGCAYHKSGMNMQSPASRSAW